MFTPNGEVNRKKLIVMKECAILYIWCKKCQIHFKNLGVNNKANVANLNPSKMINEAGKR